MPENHPRPPGAAEVLADLAQEYALMAHWQRELAEQFPSTVHSAGADRKAAQAAALAWAAAVARREAR